MSYKRWTEWSCAGVLSLSPELLLDWLVLTHLHSLEMPSERSRVWKEVQLPKWVPGIPVGGGEL